MKIFENFGGGVAKNQTKKCKIYKIKHKCMNVKGKG